MDHNVIAYEKWVSDQEDQACESCYKCAAEVNGLTAEQADLCDSGHWNCHGCPFGGSESVEKAYSKKTKRHP